MRTLSFLALAVTCFIFGGCAYTGRMAGGDTAEADLLQESVMGRDRKVSLKAINQAKERCAKENKRYLFVKHHFARKSSFGLEWFSYDLYYLCLAEGDPRMAAPPARRTPREAGPVPPQAGKEVRPEPGVAEAPSLQGAAPIVSVPHPTPSAASTPSPPPVTGEPSPPVGASPVTQAPTASPPAIPIAPQPAMPEQTTQPEVASPAPVLPEAGPPAAASGSLPAPVTDRPVALPVAPVEAEVSGGAAPLSPPVESPAATPSPTIVPQAVAPSPAPLPPAGSAVPDAGQGNVGEAPPEPQAAKEQVPLPQTTPGAQGEVESLDTTGVGPEIKSIPGSFDRKKIKEEKL